MLKLTRKIIKLENHETHIIKENSTSNWHIFIRQKAIQNQKILLVKTRTKRHCLITLLHPRH